MGRPRRAETVPSGHVLAVESQVTLRWAITNTCLRRTLDISMIQKAGRRYPVRAQTYEITFLGQAGTTLRAEFDDCEVTVGPGTTTLRAVLPDRGALSGLMERINSLGLDLIDVSLVASPPDR